MLDLDAYCARIGYAGPRAATRRTLDALIFHHVAAIPFENVDVLLDRGIDLDLAAIFDKLVYHRRGGYCFEQNTLLLHVLTALGFDATALSARVRIQRPRDFTPPRTHVFVRVELDGESLLADVGVGALSPTSSLSLLLDVEQPTPHEPRRLVADGDWQGLGLRAPTARLFHQARLGDTWVDVCELTLEPMPPIDREVGNWFTSKHPRSHFRDRLIAARATADGRVTLADRVLTVRDGEGRAVSETLPTPEALLNALEAHFGIVLPPGTRFPHLAPQWEVAG